MKIDLDFKTFCDLYYEDAKKAAERTIAGQVAKHGKLNAAIDVDLVKDLGVSYGLERVFNTYDVDHESKARIRSYLYVVVHNCVLTELGKESTAVRAKKRKQTMADFTQDDYAPGRPGTKKGFRDYIEYSGKFERKEELIAKMLECLKKLNGVDQVILDCWMNYPKARYAEEAIYQLGLEDNLRTRNMISVRCFRAIEKLQSMMKGVRTDYRDIYVPLRLDANSDYNSDYNYIRRRKRAATKSIAQGIDYQSLSNVLASYYPEDSVS